MFPRFLSQAWKKMWTFREMYYGFNGIHIQSRDLTLSPDADIHFGLYDAVWPRHWIQIGSNSIHLEPMASCWPRQRTKLNIWIQWRSTGHILSFMLSWRQFNLLGPIKRDATSAESKSSSNRTNFVVSFRPSNDSFKFAINFQLSSCKHRITHKITLV